MSDNTQLSVGSGGDVIASDDVSTLNGQASSGVKVQRVKVQYGDDGSATDVSATNPLPVTGAFYQATQPVSAVSLPLPNGAASSAAQTTGNASLANIDIDLGAQADAAATSDTGTFSVLAFIKRGLQNWTTLLARIPALVSGRVPVDGSGVTQPVSGAFYQATQPVSLSSLPLPAGAATETGNLATIVARLPPVGQATLAASQPVAIASDQVLPVTAQGELVEALEAMRMAVQAMTRTLGQMQPDTAARMRVALDSITAGLTLAAITTVTTVTTVSTLSNVTQIGGNAATEQIPSLMRLSADSMRRNITVT